MPLRDQTPSHSHSHSHSHSLSRSRSHAFALSLLLPLFVGCAQTPSSSIARLERGGYDAALLLAEVAARARSAGATGLEPVGATVVGESEQLGSFVSVPAERCLLAIARGTGNIADLDLFVFDDAGDSLGSDESQQKSAAVLVCPPHPSRVYVAARVTGGTGLAALAVMTLSPERALAVAAATDARGLAGTDSGKLDAWPGLERTIRERRARIGSSFQELRRVVLPLEPHARTAMSLQLDAGRCLDVLAVPSEELDSLVLTVEDETGRIVARHRTPAREATVLVCAHHDVHLTVSLRPRGGVGRAAVIAAVTPRGAALELAPDAWLDGLAPLVPLAAARQRHRGRMEAATSPVAAELAVEGIAELGVPYAAEVELAPGCTRIDVVGGAPLGSFGVSLWSASDRLLGEARGGEVATLFACNAVATRPRLEVNALDGRGPFAIELRRESSPSPALIAHPLAAARLLARIDAEHGPMPPSLAAVDALALAEGERHTRAFALPKGACRQWLVAADGPAALGLAAYSVVGSEPAAPPRAENAVNSGAERRPAEATALGLARGPRTVALTLCAADAPITGRIVLTNSASATQLLWHERSSP
ncbi:MAG: hypothetical protein EXR75_06900 [Myxococcales bacterium]|nr:hypothetical protein [Myxococcales bacterium]